MKVFIICMTHKRTLNHVEILRIFTNKEKAELYLLEINKGRAFYSQFTLKEYDLND